MANTTYQSEHSVGAAWSCKIGSREFLPLPLGCDAPMRRAVEKAFKEITGEDAEFTFSGWSAKLTEGEMACVENRLPHSDDYKRHLMEKAAPELLEALERIAALTDERISATLVGVNSLAREAIARATGEAQ